MFAEHEKHLSDQRQRQGNRNPETPYFVAISKQFGCLLAVAGLAIDQFGRKTRLGDGGNDGFRIRPPLEAHASAFGRQIDIGLHPRLAVEYFFQTGRTGGTRHATDGKFEDPGRRACCLGFAHLTRSTGQGAR